MDPQSRLICWNGLQMSLPRSCQEIIHAPTHLLVEADYQPVLEIRWQRRQKGSQPASPESVLRELSRQKHRSCTTIHLPPPFSGFARDRNVTGIQWENREQGLGMIWQCQSCGTVFFCHLYQQSALPQELVAEILSTLECCNQDRGFSRWALQDFRLTVPARFLYHSSSFGAGFTRLTFQNQEQFLHICRLAPASEKLARQPAREILCSLHEQFASKKTQCRENGNVFECWTTPSLMAQVHSRLRKKKPFCFGIIRHDESSDRLLGVSAESTRPVDPDLVRRILDHYEVIR